MTNPPADPPPADPPPGPPQAWQPTTRDDWVSLFSDGFKKAHEESQPPPADPPDTPPARKTTVADWFLGKPRE
jgi:hypothetical protein